MFTCALCRSDSAYTELAIEFVPRDLPAGEVGPTVCDDCATAIAECVTAVLTEGTK